MAKEIIIKNCKFCNNLSKYYRCAENDSVCKEHLFKSNIEVNKDIYDSEVLK